MMIKISIIFSPLVISLLMLGVDSLEKRDEITPFTPCQLEYYGRCQEALDWDYTSDQEQEQNDLDCQKKAVEYCQEVEK